MPSAKKKLSEVVQQMHILKNGLEDPDSIPVNGQRMQRLALKSHFELDKETKKYVPVSPMTLANSKHAGKKANM